MKWNLPKRLECATRVLLIFCVLLLPSCAALRPPGQQVTLKQAVEASVDALKVAEVKAKQHGHSWGLLPADVTLTYSISNERNSQAGVTVGTPPTPIGTASAQVLVSKTTRSGNQIVMRFTKGGRP